MKARIVNPTITFQRGNIKGRILFLFLMNLRDRHIDLNKCMIQYIPYTYNNIPL